jgi:hypothetical protein
MDHLHAPGIRISCHTFYLDALRSLRASARLARFAVKTIALKRVIRLTASLGLRAYPQIRAMAVPMAESGQKMNSFERTLFRVALALGALVVAVRLGFVGVVWYLHHIR